MATATEMSPSTLPPNPPMEDFAAMFEESLSRQEMRQGELITAEVVRVELTSAECGHGRGPFASGGPHRTAAYGNHPVYVSACTSRLTRGKCHSDIPVTS